MISVRFDSLATPARRIYRPIPHSEDSEDHRSATPLRSGTVKACAGCICFCSRISFVLVLHQGMFVGECMVDAIARHLRLAPEAVRAVNLYQQGDITPYMQPLNEYTVPQQWAHIEEHTNFKQQRAEIAEFNAKNRHRKRGMAVIPTKFGIAFTAKFLNQAGALVLVYTDGTVLINCGGTEIGQGLFTKMCQVAAHAFQIPFHMVRISDTATDKTANASPTAASASSDLNGAAILDACNQILARLAPLKKAHPTKTWCELVSMAYFERIQLTAAGFYATPGVGYDWVKMEGQPFNYYSQSARSRLLAVILTALFSLACACCLHHPSMRCAVQHVSAERFALLSRVAVANTCLFFSFCP